MYSTLVYYIMMLALLSTTLEAHPEERTTRNASNVSSYPRIEFLRGRDGRDGRDGVSGPPGEKGERGLQGNNAIHGTAGPRGPVGEKGEQGDQGQRGVTGPGGPQGPQGLTGAKGDSGSIGPSGRGGRTGPQGPQGPQGLTGAKGDPGAMGHQGEQGIPGRQGSRGIKGEKGDRGNTGIKGSQGRPGPGGPQGPVGPKGDRGSQGPPGSPGQRGSPGRCDNCNNCTQTYVRWGRTTCPGNISTELVYSGRAGGSWYGKTGGATNYLCMPDNPDYLQYDSSVQGFNYVYGVEYEPLSGQPLSGLWGRNIPCALCMAVSRCSMIMIPAKTQCPSSSWTTEYVGYLMSAHQAHILPTRYECVDKDPESVPGLDASGHSSGSGIFTHVEASCNGMKCPPYVAGRELTCVVCTR